MHLSFLAFSFVLLGLTQGAGHGPHCTDHVDHNCKQIPKQEERKECHVEYDIVEDVTYIEECKTVVITECEEEHETVEHSSHVVGHDVHKYIEEGHHHHHHHGGHDHHHGGHIKKREALEHHGGGHHHGGHSEHHESYQEEHHVETHHEPIEHHHKGHQHHSVGPKCHDKHDKQCHKMPKKQSHKVPRHLCKTIVDTTYIEECEEIITTRCEETHSKSFHTSHVVGHDSILEKHHQPQKH